MSALNMVFLFFAALIAGTLNSVAGGGSFISFPTLIFTGVPAVMANATNTVALWPGTLSSVVAYRNELKTQRQLMIVLGSASLVGGLLGALILLRTPESVFLNLVPYLLLLATLLFTFGGKVTEIVRNRFENAVHSRWVTLVGIGLIQLIISTYGGYFGGGIGMLMLASLALIGMTNIHSMNALKTLLATLINGIAVIAFILAHAVMWPQALTMIAGSILGGYGGAHFAQRIAPRYVRYFVIVVGFTMTLYFFVR